MRKDKYIRVSTAKAVVLTGGCGECKLQRYGHCEGCRTQTILDLLDDVAKTGGVEIPQRHGRLIDADANIKVLNACIEKPENDIARECYKYAKTFLNACPSIIQAASEGGTDG